MLSPSENTSDINRVIADNLRNLRNQLDLSLSETASLTGVSKSMLGQIERGESSPTVSTLWKISTGLQISFTSLMERAEPEAKITRESDMTPVLSDQGRFRIYPAVPAREDLSFELLDLDFDPGARSESQPHAPGTEEFVLVYLGELEIRLGDDGAECYTVSQGSVIHYKADRKHIYRNVSENQTRAVMIINYAGKPTK